MITPADTAPTSRDGPRDRVSRGYLVALLAVVIALKLGLFGLSARAIGHAAPGNAGLFALTTPLFA